MCPQWIYQKRWEGMESMLCVEELALVRVRITFSETGVKKEIVRNDFKELLLVTIIAFIQDFKVYKGLCKCYFIVAL